MEKSVNTKSLIIKALIIYGILVLIGFLVIKIGNAIVAANAPIPTNTEIEQLIVNDLTSQISSIGNKYKIDDLKIDAKIEEITITSQRKPTMMAKGYLEVCINGDFVLKSSNFARIKKEIESLGTVEENTDGYRYIQWHKEPDSLYDYYADIRDDAVNILDNLQYENYNIRVTDSSGRNIDYVSFKDIKNNIIYDFDHIYESSGVKLERIKKNGEQIWEEDYDFSGVYSCNVCKDTGKMYYTNGEWTWCSHCY